MGIGLDDFGSGVGARRAEFVGLLLQHLEAKRNEQLEGRGSEEEQAALVRSRFEEREDAARGTFEDFALNGEIRIGDLADLIPEFAKVLELEMEAATPDALEHMSEFFSLNAAPMGGETVAEYITYEAFVDLLYNFVRSTGKLAITDLRPAPAAPRSADGDPPQDDA